MDQSEVLNLCAGIGALTYCVGVMELGLLNLLILVVICVILTLVGSLRACHMQLTRNHMFIRKILGTR